MRSQYGACGGTNYWRGDQRGAGASARVAESCDRVHAQRREVGCSRTCADRKRPGGVRAVVRGHGAIRRVRGQGADRPLTPERVGRLTCPVGAPAGMAGGSR
jgi:hypothetical protein